MTFNVGHVQGGTNAGRKRPLRPKPHGWMCECEGFSVKPGYLAKCPDCKTERPT